MVEAADQHHDALWNVGIDPQVPKRQAGHQRRAGTHGLSHFHEPFRDDAAIRGADFRVANALARGSNARIRRRQSGGSGIPIRGRLVELRFGYHVPLEQL